MFENGLHWDKNRCKHPAGQPKSISPGNCLPMTGIYLSGAHNLILKHYSGCKRHKSGYRHPGRGNRQSVFLKCIRTGNLLLDKIGFAPFAVLIACIVALTQEATSALLLVNRQVTTPSIINIGLHIMAIVLLHFKEGWLVVGGGWNGI